MKRRSLSLFFVIISFGISVSSFFDFWSGSWMDECEFIKEFIQNSGSGLFFFLQHRLFFQYLSSIYYFFYSVCDYGAFFSFVLGFFLLEESNSFPFSSLSSSHFKSSCWQWQVFGLKEKRINLKVLIIDRKRVRGRERDNNLAKTNELCCWFGREWWRMIFESPRLR